MEGQSEDCPFPAHQLHLVAAYPRRNGGAVGRLPVSWGALKGESPLLMPQWRGSRKTARFRWGIRDLDFPLWPQWRGSRKTARFSCSSLVRAAIARPPQWRGSRKTARFPGERPQSVHSVDAAMEGQSEDCPFLERDLVNTLVKLGLAAMEGQSEDCPFPDRAAMNRMIDTSGPQWRGSRKTARFPLA